MDRPQTASVCLRDRYSAQGRTAERDPDRRGSGTEPFGSDGRQFVELATADTNGDTKTIVSRTSRRIGPRSMPWSISFLIDALLEATWPTNPKTSGGSGVAAYIRSDKHPEFVAGALR